jgi:uncharacterized protein (DUF362 family)
VLNLTAHLRQLTSQQNPDGGWPYVPGQASHLEPTCFALLALAGHGDELQPALDRGLHAVRACARPDGTYRLAEGREEAVWPTALVLFVLSVLEQPATVSKSSISALLALRGQCENSQEASEVQDIDLKLTGWPWGEGNFSWAEPTAWACLALRRAGHGLHPRVVEGLQMLLDRALDEGGINYGNRRILGRMTEPIPGPTALMLLALQGQAPHPRIKAAVQYLLRTDALGDDLEHLCWARLALDLYPKEPGVANILPRLDERIEAAYRRRSATPWLRPALLRDALTVLALEVPRGNPFRLPVAAIHHGAAEPPAVAAPKAKRQALGERLKSTFRGLAVETANRLKQLPPLTPVHIARASAYDIDLTTILSQQYAVFRERVPLAGKRVVLKPNLVEYHRDKVINTSPAVVAAAIELCRQEGAAEIIVAEGPGHWRNVEHLVSASGLGDVLRQHKVPFVDLNHDDFVKRPNLGRLTGLEFLYLSKTVATADVLISLPKLKTHHWAGATLSLKNLFGTLPGICYGWPKNELHWRGIDNSIVDIALTRTPDLAIVDGIVGMEGDGPLNGTAKHMGLLVMGCDPLAVDTTCCRVMQLDPEKIGYLVMAQRKKLGLFRANEIQQIGELIEAVAQPFDTVPHFRHLRLTAPPAARQPGPAVVAS